MNTVLVLAPAIPLLAAAIIPWLPSRASGIVASSSLAASVACSFALLPGGTNEVRLPWLSTGGHALDLTLAPTPIGILGACLVSVVSLLVMIYSTGYIEPRRPRFFAQMTLFAGAMVALVLAGDLILLFIAWEIVGVCSYLLIGFELEQREAAGAASKALMVTRVGDVLLLLGFVALIARFGTTRIGQLGPAAPWIALLVLAGAAAKSAQVPFQGWLPDAMVGPAPVSALLHSATMVAAGAFLLARLSSVIPGGVLPVVAWTGIATALLGGLLALSSDDLKRALAYSTISQLGFMWLAVGSGSAVAAVTLLVAHALYKSVLFLAAGAVQRSVGGTEFKRMGGLARKMPFTFACALLGSLALAGLPVTFALPVKDATLAAALRAGGWLFAAAMVASVLTAAYATRILWRTFLARPPANAEEPGLAMRIGMGALSILIPVAMLGRPAARFLGAELPESLIATIAGLAAAAAGIGLGAWGAARGHELAPMRSEMGLRPLYTLIARATLWFASACDAIDQVVFSHAPSGLADAIANLIRGIARIDGASIGRWPRRFADSIATLARGSAIADRAAEQAIRSAAGGVLLGSERARRIETGRIENYLAYAFAGVLVVSLAAALAIGGR